MEEKDSEKPLDFIRNHISKDVANKKNDGRVQTRFPPEPNGYLHLGHAKSICLNFGIANEFNGLCNLRLDDTNPVAEKVEYAEAIKDDVRWLGFTWEQRLFHASDYFDLLYEWAVFLIKKEKAFVCDLSFEQIKKFRGDLVTPGENSPCRSRSVEENLELFESMKNGKFKEGEKTLRAKIDMSSPNLNLRDPIIYRIIKKSHPRTGDKWNIYPSYDFAHGQSDSIEGITHSLCTLEFEHHRPLYDWFCENLEIHHPQQIEFARLNLTYTVMSKRKMLRLVEEKHVSGWDDPRMPTLQGMRRRGFSAQSIKDFCSKVGLAKRENTIEVELLEHCLRNDLNKRAHRRLGVLNPLKLTIKNYPSDKSETVFAVNNPEDDSTGTRQVPFSGSLFIDKDDFMEDPPKKYFRLAPGREVRLKYAYYITCEQVVKDENGEITEVICKYDPNTKGGDSADGRRVKGTIQWVDAKTAVPTTIRKYDRLFSVPNPEDFSGDGDFINNLNPNSLVTLNSCLTEQGTNNLNCAVPFQLERIGYFCKDKDSKEENLILNQTVALRDSWNKKNKNK